MIALVDSHCHLDMLDLTPDSGQLQPMIDRAKAHGVQFMLNVSVNLRDFPQVLRTAEAYPFVAASVGVHPNEEDEVVDVETLIQLGQHPKIIAIGETGLDYYRSTGDLTWQQDRFRTHIQAAAALQKPLIIHTRQASDDTLRIMREEKADIPCGVMHCFTENWEVAKAALDIGFYISFSGIVTFKNAIAIQEVAKKVPIDRLLIETDAPYLAPLPHRGKPNEPSYVRYTAEFLAKWRGMPLHEFAEATTNNFYTLFKVAV